MISQNCFFLRFFIHLKIKFDKYFIFKKIDAMSSKKFGLYLGPSVFFLILLFFNPEDLNAASKAVLASSLWIAIWWISEALPISVTALLPMILFPLTGGMELADTTASYGHKWFFLLWVVL